MVALGPAIGFLMGSLFVSEWINIGNDKNIDGIIKSDPRWIGRWWAGFIFSSCLLLLLSFILFTFPSHLQQNNNNNNQIDQSIRESDQQVGSICLLSNIKGFFSFYIINKSIAFF